MIRYYASKIIPVWMRTEYGLIERDGSVSHWRASWVQWRGRVYRNRVVAAA